jgi:hypothetical protein
MPIFFDFFDNLLKYKGYKMQITQKVRCPNCGSHAERHYFQKSELIQTQCRTCDYLMINCSRTWKVVEAYAPGIYAHR